MYNSLNYNNICINIYMDLCFICLIACSICWTLSPILYTNAGNYYTEGDYQNLFRSGGLGFIAGVVGTVLFMIASQLCNTITSSVTYTYSLPIVFTTIASIFLYGEVLEVKSWIGVFLIICGLYLI